MKKVALVFVLAVFVPSLVLAWLAVRSLRDQQFVLERQQNLLYQSVTDTLAQKISDHLAQQQQEFSTHAESIASPNAALATVQFDSEIRRTWPLAEVGFSVTLSGPVSCTLTCPSPAAGPGAQKFLVDNGGFLGNQEVAEVYWNISGRQAALGVNQLNPPQTAPLNSPSANQVQPSQQRFEANPPGITNNDSPGNSFFSQKSQNRAVNPQGGNYQVLAQQADSPPPDLNLSKVIPAEAEFRQLIGGEMDGMLARFLQNKLKLMFWHRLNSNSNLIFGAQLNLDRVIAGLRNLVQPDPELRDEICVALLDDNARPVVISRDGFEANWKHPFVASEIGEALPHWEMAVYLRNPARLGETARATAATLGLLIVLLLLAIGVGSWLIVNDLRRQLRLARQKTDFVSNVSHELKTPLTSIRMFSELLAEGRVNAPEKQRSYLNIITAETARLTRLINNVLDFSRMERGEKEYQFTTCNLVSVAQDAAETFRPHLESTGFRFDISLPAFPVNIRADRDAVAQVIVNLLSNAEKYSNGTKQITLQVTGHAGAGRWAELKVLDRGPGVPREAHERIFEKFYRANDSLTNSVQGSGLGLTLARQIARTHGGDVVYAPRDDGGGSCFTLRLPLSS